MPRQGFPAVNVLLASVKNALTSLRGHDRNTTSGENVMRRRQSFAVIAAAAWTAVIAASAAWAQGDYPSRPVRLIVGFPPGSSADIAARVVGNRMTQVFGQ